MHKTDKIQHHFIIKTLKKLVMEGMYPDTLKHCMTNPQLTLYRDERH